MGSPLGLGAGFPQLSPEGARRLTALLGRFLLLGAFLPPAVACDPDNSPRPNAKPAPAAPPEASVQQKAPAAPAPFHQGTWKGASSLARLPSSLELDRADVDPKKAKEPSLGEPSVKEARGGSALELVVTLSVDEPGKITGEATLQGREGRASGTVDGEFLRVRLLGETWTATLVTKRTGDSWSGEARASALEGPTDDPGQTPLAGAVQLVRGDAPR